MTGTGDAPAQRITIVAWHVRLIRMTLTSSGAAGPCSSNPTGAGTYVAPAAWQAAEGVPARLSRLQVCRLQAIVLLLTWRKVARCAPSE